MEQRPPLLPPTESAVTLTGTVERITFHNDDNGYTVARFKIPRQSDLVTIVGNFPSITAGESLRLTGRWATHPKHGPQFSVVSSVVRVPATLTGIEKYLGSGLIKGIGPVTARRIVAHFGLQTLDVIENNIERLADVPSVKGKRLDMISQAWAAQKSIKEVMLFLQGHDISTAYAVKIYKTYGDQAIGIVRDNPYRLAEDIYGIGFVTADRIAQALGMPLDSPHRLRAGLVHVLREAADNGHCYMPYGELLAQTTAALRQENTTQLTSLLRAMLAAHELIGDSAIEPAQNDDQAPLPLEMAVPTSVAAPPRVAEPPAAVGDPPATLPIYVPSFYHTERALAAALRQLRNTPVPGVDAAWVTRWVARFAQEESMTLSPDQARSVVEAATRRLFVLTGGPGCGKTTTTRAIVRLMRALGKRILLASPTGRASQRLAEVTGCDARTLHRLLEFSPAQGTFLRDRDNPLDADVVIVDEASMLDLFLAHALVRAIPPTGHLILVGDADQLPSVGPGAVLRDLLASQTIAAVHLNQVFRQAQQSLIVTNAHRINQGEMPQLLQPGTAQADCYFLPADEPEQIATLVRRIVSTDLPRRLGYHPVRDIQVLCPQNRGTVGARHLNTILQDALNPATAGLPQVTLYGHTLRRGDKVIQMVNNYRLQVFNGDIGIVADVDREEQTLRVAYPDHEVVYDYHDANELTLSYAISIHKAQGSEFPAVIIPLHAQHFTSLTRNLLYTGLTRARRTVVLVGTRAAIGMAVRNTEASRRYTKLATRLAHIGAPIPLRG